MATDKLADFDHVTDYISREAAIVQKCDCEAYDPKTGMIFECDAVPVERINAIPAADVRPVVRGRWEIMSDPRFRRCSVCHDKVVFNMKNLPNFCDVCGADMRGSNLDTTKGDNHD